METLKEVLMRRDGMSESEAKDLIKNAREDLMNQIASGEYVDEDEFCSDWFGLEPDYIMDII